MIDTELKKTFPYGVMVLPRAENETSYPALAKPDEMHEGYFAVWDSPYHERYVSLDVTPQGDGFLSTFLDGEKVFLRPLTKEQAVKF